MTIAVKDNCLLVRNKENSLVRNGLFVSSASKNLDMGLLREFKEFAVKGNMMDMAIGIIIGAAFNKVIDVLVKKILMPPLALLTNGINFDNKKIILREGSRDVNGVILTDDIAIGYGALAEAFVDFIIVGFTIFIVVKFMNRLRSKAQDTKDTTVATPKDIELLTKVKDLLEEQNALLKSNNN